MTGHAPTSGASSSDSTTEGCADPLALMPGSALAQFRVVRVLGSGGFGIVYLAHDDLLHRDVAIKEYLPASLAGRTREGQVVARSAESAAAFDVGLKSFVNEARLLARFDHASLVKVHGFWEEHGTAYMVMPYYVGATLRQVRKSLGEPPDEKWLKRLLAGLLGAIEALHRANVVHRDVAPDNIVMLRDGAPLLLDFGAARHVLAEQSQMLTATLKPTYAPIEQYATSSGAGDLRQGPWTDLYATAATLHYLLTGEAPPAATARTLDDRYQPLHQRADLRQRDGLPYDGRWLAAIDWALEVLPGRRPQSVAQWRSVLDGRRSVPRQTLRAAGAGQALECAADHAPVGVHASQWPPTLSDSAPTDAAEVKEPAISVAVKPKHAATDKASRHSNARGGRSPASPIGGLRDVLYRKGWIRGWREKLVAAGALGLVSMVGLAQFSVLPQLGRSSPAPMVSPQPINGTINGNGGADTSGMATPTVLPPQPTAAGGLQEFPASPSHSSQEIHETAADQGRVIKVPPRSFGARDAGSGTGRVTRTAADGSEFKPIERRRKVARAPVIQTPREFCEGDDRNWFSRMICMHKSCDLPKWREHAQCANWHRPMTAQGARTNDAY